MREKIENIRKLIRGPAAGAALTGLAVFAGLYLVVGIGLFGFNVWNGLRWPYRVLGCP